MSEPIPFDEQDPRPDSEPAAFLLDLDGFEGPIDLLLELARDQKVDLTRISILALADQYLAFIQQARTLRLELAADYLVMAAWLAYLKSRLLLPEAEDGEEPSGAEMAAALKFQLQRLQAMQDAGARLMARGQLGSDFFPRGEPERLKIVTRPIYVASLYELLQAYARNALRAKVTNLHIRRLDYYSVEDALLRLGSLIGDTLSWRSLFAFLPADLRDELTRRSAVAATFAASLEMAKQGKLTIRQDGLFGPIYLRGIAEQK